MKRLLIATMALALAAFAPAALAQHAAPEPHGEAQPEGHAQPHAPATGPAHAPTGAAHVAPHAAPHGGVPEGEHLSEDAHAAAGGTHGGGHAAGGHHGPAAINWTDLSDKSRPAFIALVINFGILFGLYYVLGKKPVAAALKQRRVNIGARIEEADKMYAAAQERAKKYQADLKNVDDDAATTKSALVEAGKGEVTRMLSDANEKAERMKRDADRLVEQERKQARQDLVVETVDLAMVEAQKLLERSVTPQDHARLAEDLLAELSRAPAASATRTVGGAS